MKKKDLALFCAALWVGTISFNAHAQTATDQAPPLAEASLTVSQPGVQDIYLLIGQSNMSGVAPIGVLDQEVLENVYLFNTAGQWEKATNTDQGFNRYTTAQRSVPSRSNRLNAGTSFGRKIANYTGRKIGIVSNALGGTRISWWQKGYAGENDFDLYEKAVTRAKQALAASPDAELKGIIWHQGEGDNSPLPAAAYAARLSQLVADLRADLNVPGAVFIAGEVGKWKGRGMGVNPVIRQIAQYIPRSDFVNSEGLTSINLPKNDPHFDTLSQRVLGERYADKVLEMVYGISPGVATLYSGPEYSQRAITLRDGNYSATDLERFGVPLNELASIKVQAGHKLIFLSAADGANAIEIAANTPQFSLPDGIEKIVAIKIVAAK